MKLSKYKFKNYLNAISFRLKEIYSAGVNIVTI